RASREHARVTVCARQQGHRALKGFRRCVSHRRGHILLSWGVSGSKDRRRAMVVSSSGPVVANAFDCSRVDDHRIAMRGGGRFRRAPPPGGAVGAVGGAKELGGTGKATPKSPGSPKPPPPPRLTILPFSASAPSHCSTTSGLFTRARGGCATSDISAM